MVSYRIVHDEKSEPSTGSPHAGEEGAVAIVRNLPLALDWRTAVRYPLALPARYRLRGRQRRTKTVPVKTIDLSTKAIRFSADRELQPGTAIELSIDWPWLRDDKVKLQLVAVGTVIRSAGLEAVMQISRHTFSVR